MCGAPRVLPVHRHTSEHQGQVQDHQQGLLLQVQREDPETDAGARQGELRQETIISEVGPPVEHIFFKLDFPLNFISCQAANFN